MKNLLGAILCAVTVAGFAFDTAEAVTARAPGTVFLQGETLEFHLKVPGSWTLLNWMGEVLRQGEGGEKLVLAPLPNGYYKLELKGGTGCRTFTVVPDPAKREKNPDQFFAMDSAQSWLARPDKHNSREPEKTFETVSEVARRSGVQMVRERLHWGEIEATPGKFDWMQYKTNADLLAGRGVQVLGMYHYAPSWTVPEGGRLPHDLLATCQFAKKAAEVFQGRMTAWEFWNEQDIGYAPEGAWDYAAALKAASLGFKMADPEIPVLIGGYAHTPLSPYADVVMENGAGEYFDIFNFHSYRRLVELPDAVRSVREFMARHNIADYPVWVTENGSGMEGGGLVQSHVGTIKAHSPEQEMIIAEYLPKMMLSMQMGGVNREFFFVLPPFNELSGSKDWGLMRRDYSVKPAYTAFATLVDKLGNARLEGEIKLADGVKGLLYRQKDNTQTLVFWSVSPLESSRQLPDPAVMPELLKRDFTLPAKDVLNGVDLFGSPFSIENGRATATRYPAFLDQVNLKPTTPFHAPEVTSLPTKRSAFDKTVIFRAELSDDFTMFSAKDCADVKRDSARFTLQVWNLSDRQKQGTVKVGGGQCAGVPETVTLAPFSKQEFFLTFTPALDENFKGELRAEGSFEGRKTTPFVIPLQSRDAINTSGRTVLMPQMADPANWRANSSGKMEFKADRAEETIHFRTRFPLAADRWSYPEYSLQLPQESLAGAIGISFEAKVSDPAAVIQMLLMILQPGQKDLYLKADQPGKEFQEFFIPLPPELDPANITKLRIGLNSRIDDITLSIRNVKIFYKR